MATEEGSRWPVWAVVRQARNLAGLEVADLAERSGVDVSEIEAIEAAETAPTTDVLFRLVEACGFELRLVVAAPDGQRQAHREAAASRTATQRLAANHQAMLSVANLRRRS